MYLFLYCVLCFFILYCVYYEAYMYDAVRMDFALSASFVLECFDGSEVTTRRKIVLWRK